MKVIMEAGSIPEDSTVTKIHGEKRYLLKKEIKFYGDKGPPTSDYKNIKADNSVRFLVCAGQVNVIAASKEIVWVVDSMELEEYLHSYREGKQ